MPRSPSPRGDVVEVCCSSTPEFVSLVRGDWELAVGPRPCVGRGTLRPPLSHSRLLARIIDDARFSSNWAGTGPLSVQGTPIYLAGCRSSLDPRRDLDEQVVTVESEPCVVLDRRESGGVIGWRPSFVFVGLDCVSDCGITRGLKLSSGSAAATKNNAAVRRGVAGVERKGAGNEAPVAPQNPGDCQATPPVGLSSSCAMVFTCDGWIPGLSSGGCQ